MTLHPFDPIRALKTLIDHRVRFVVIGGFAGRLWGSTTVTNDLDICYARDRKNLEALSAALNELEASLRGAPAGPPSSPTPRHSRAGITSRSTPTREIWTASAPRRDPTDSWISSPERGL